MKKLVLIFAIMIMNLSFGQDAAVDMEEGVFANIHVTLSSAEKPYSTALWMRYGKGASFVVEDKLQVNLQAHPEQSGSARLSLWLIETGDGEEMQLLQVQNSFMDDEPLELMAKSGSEKYSVTVKIRRQTQPLECARCGAE